MTPGPFKVSSMSLGFNNGPGHPWIVRSARDALGFQWGVLVKNRAKNTTDLQDQPDRRLDI